MHLIDVIESHVQRRCDAPAVHFLPDGLDIAQTLSFADLHAQSRSLAGALQARHAAGDRVLLALHSSLDFVLGFFACMYADLIAVPLFPPQSRKPRHLDRLRSVIADSQPALILCPQEACEALSELSTVPVLTMDALRSFAPAAWDRPASSGAAIAFLQYTSGSTGAPKGVVVRQRNLLANLALMQRACGYDEHGRMVTWLPLYHDMGLIGGLLAPLYSGMPCYLMAPQTFVKTPSLWLQALSRHRGTASYAPNFAYALCNRTVSDALIDQLDLSAWEHAITGAEPIHAATVATFSERFARAGFRPRAHHPGYGQAEATLCVTATPPDALPVVLRLDKPMLEAGRAVPASGHDAVELVACGYPQPGHEIAIVDPHDFTRCAAGSVGEIWLAGPSNAEGYWNRQDATRETFEARVAGEAGNWLRSGDLGFMHEGQVVVCGRLKDLVILNGRNLYPNDLEFAITDAEPGIRAGRIAAFAVADGDLGREKLVVVAEPHRRYIDPARHTALFASMQQAVREAADCAIDVIVLIEPGTIPMTTSGKISRQGAKRGFLEGGLGVIATSTGNARALPSVSAQRLREGLAAGENMRAMCLAYLARVVQSLRADAQPTPDTSLVVLGLDSITLATFAARLDDEFGWAPALAHLFSERTLGDWALALEQHLASPPASADARALPTGSSEVRQSYAQRRLWFAHQFEPERAQHNVVSRIRLRGRIAADELQARLSSAVARHAVLRSVYRNGADGPVQCVLENSEPVLTRSDLRGLAPAGQDDAVETCIAAERVRSLDLSAGPVLCAQLLSRTDDVHDLVLNVHHIAFDGRSANVLLSELAGNDALASPAYTDFSAWETTQWTGATLDTELAFWRSHLEGTPRTLDLGGITGVQAAQTFELPQARCDRIAQLARERGMTSFMVLLALFQLVLHHASGQSRFVIGTDVAGRPPRFENTIGFFVNQLALRCVLDGDPTISEFFEQTRAEARAAYAHQALPFDLLVSSLAPERIPGRAPLFQAKLNYQPAQAEGLVLAGARVAGIEVSQDLGYFDLVLDLVHGRGGIAATLKHRLDAEQAALIQHLWLRLAAEFEPLLPLRLSAAQTLLREWDRGWRQERQQASTAQARSRLAQTRRRPLTV
jgi:acyl-CoA synthetase (AMP-forming)/AMP-acid ligase II/acyl carrier protein